MNQTIALLAASLLVSGGQALAANEGQPGVPSSAPAATATAAPAEMAEAEVRKIDMDNKKITLKHGEIKNLQMPGMTMVFQVKDPAMLQSVKVGDRVRFAADKISGAFTVTAMQLAQ